MPMTLPTLTQSPRDPVFVQDPYPFYERARAAGPLFRWQDYGIACAPGFDQVNNLLRDRRFGREAPPGFQPRREAHTTPFYAIDDLTMLAREPPTHTRLRGLVLKAFTSRMIGALAPGITELSHRLVDDFAGDTIDLIPTFAEKLPVIIIARLLGVPEQMWRQLLDWSHAMVGMYQARRDRAMEDAAVDATLTFSDFLRSQIAERRKSPRGDLISALIAARDQGEKLSEDELIATLILLLNAGHEATVHTIGNGVKALLETNYSGPINEGVTEEILRFDPPLHLFTRYALEPVEFAGHQFSTGDEVGLMLAAANRDPARYANPARFDPVRGGTGQLSFGAGIHFCVGAPLARLELMIGLPILFSRCPGLRLAKPPTYANIYHFHGLESLMVTAV